MRVARTLLLAVASIAGLINSRASGGIQYYVDPVNGNDTTGNGGAGVEVLNAIYETDFLGFSYGFRPGAASTRRWMRSTQGC